MVDEAKGAVTYMMLIHKYPPPESCPAKTDIELGLWDRFFLHNPIEADDDLESIGQCEFCFHKK